MMAPTQKAVSGKTSMETMALCMGRSRGHLKVLYAKAMFEPAAPIARPPPRRGRSHLLL